MSTNAYITELIKTVYNGPLQVIGNGSNVIVKVKDRARVKTDLYAYLDKYNYPYQDIKTSKSSFNATQLKTPDGTIVHIIYKDTVNNGSGAGAEITELAESAQCWYAAVAFNYELQSLDDFLKYKDKVTAKCSTSATVDKIVDELTYDWIQSSIIIANYMREMSEFKTKKNQYHFHHGSAIINKISEMFHSANRKDPQFANINKWNPADVWLITPTGEAAIRAASRDQTFASLNDIVTELYQSRDAVGVSLKKVVNTVRHEVFNYQRSATTCELKSFKVSEKSKDGYLIFQYKDDSNMSIQFRSFSDARGWRWQGEIKGKYASGGKIGGGQVAAIFKRVSGITLSSMSANEVAKRVQRHDPKIYNSIRTMAKKFNVTVVDPVLQSADWVYSKYLTLELFTALKQLPKDKQEQFLREVVGYAASSTENSGVFIKIS
jgi:hypothetical protein